MRLPSDDSQNRVRPAMNRLLLPASNPSSIAAASLARTSGSPPRGARESRCRRSRSPPDTRRVSFETLNDAALYLKDSDGAIEIAGVALPQGVRLIGLRSSLPRSWKAIWGGISRSGRGRNSARCTGITNKDRSCSPSVHAGLPRSGIAHSDTGFVNAGDRVRLYDPELAAVAREVEQAPAAVEIRLILVLRGR
jgi:hypothetical protein